MPPLRKFLCLGFAVAVLAGAHTASATDPNILAPYRYQPAPQQLSPLEQQKAQIYKNQVQNQVRTLESQDQKGQLNSFQQETLRNSQSEIFRMNGVLGQ